MRIFFRRKTAGAIAGLAMGLATVGATPASAAHFHGGGLHHGGYGGWHGGWRGGYRRYGWGGSYYGGPYLGGYNGNGCPTPFRFAGGYGCHHY
jgi:hypothetical protein